MISKILSDNLTYAQVNSESPNICFLHGWGGESNDWKNISKDFECIVIDIPGFGKSVPFEQSGSPEFYAEYLVELIPDSVEIIVGVSFGGVIAVHLSQLKKYQSKKIGNTLIFVSVISLIIQSLLVSYTYTINENIGSFYLFYAVVVLFTLTFLYVYRFQMNEKYYLYWGIALLYLMGLEMRTIDTIGEYLN